VEAADILRIGLYYGETNNLSRGSVGTYWGCNSRLPWTADSGQPRIIFADADGNNIVNSADVIPIGLNYGKTHAVAISKTVPFPTAEQTTSDAIISFVAPSSIRAGHVFAIDAHVNSAKAIYGIAFNFRYRVIGKNTRPQSDVGLDLRLLGIDKDGSSLGTNLLDFSSIQDSIGASDYAMTATMGDGYLGGGKLISIRMEASTALTDEDTISIEITRPVANDKFGNPILVQGDLATLIVNGNNKPRQYLLEQNYPNPFNPTTFIRFELPVSSKIMLKIYDVLGREVATLVDETRAAGFYNTSLEGSKLVSGVYYYRLTAMSMENPSRIFDQVKKTILMR